MESIRDQFRARVKEARRATPYHHTRWVRCTQCPRKYKVAVSSEPGLRLRDRGSQCCDARMRPLNWRPRKSA